MTNNKIIAVLAVIIIVGFGIYKATYPGMLTNITAPELVENGTTVQNTSGGKEVEPTKDNPSGVSQKSSIEWRFTNAPERDGMPQTNVTVVINNKAYEVGKFTGSCSEIGASGGVDGKGLLAGELSATQCWFAGGGDEIGVFAHEDGGFDIMTGKLSEGEEGAGLFRGDFKVKQVI